MTLKKIYLPGLNGLRAIAAISVVIAHISLEGVADFGIPIIDIPMAGYGVTMFFVISGFLITFLLIREKEKINNISVGKFYVRRILRIWPLYYLYIILCVGFYLLINKSHIILVEELWWYVFFSANIPFVLQSGILILVHLWSIGVEEQFYLFWPWVVKFSKKMLRVSIVILVVFFMLKFTAYFFFGKFSFLYRFVSVTRFHCMMFGAVGAILYDNKHFIINLMTMKWVQIVSWLIFFLIGFGMLSFPSIISNEFIALISLFLIVGQIEEKGILRLEKPIFDLVGKISYGTYIIHPLVIILLSRLFKSLEMDLTAKIILVYFTVITLTLTLSWISYHFYESKFLKLKSRFMIIKSANSMKLK